MSTFSEKLAYYRNLIGYSLDDLALLTGIPKTTLHRYEKGTNKRDPAGDKILILEVALRIKPGTLLGITKDESIPITPKENIVLAAYRKQPNLQPEVDRILGIGEKPLHISPSQDDTVKLVASDGALMDGQITDPGKAASTLRNSSKNKK